MQKTGFIYLWFDKKHKRFYLGSHWGTEDDGYICSSRWMRKAYRRRPQDFKRRIIQCDISRKELIDQEHKWLALIKNEELGKKYYNLIRERTGSWAHDEVSRLTVSQKISKSLKGKPKTEEHKQKIILNHRGTSGKKFSEETKRRMSEAHKGVTHSEESKEKIRQKKLGIPRSKECIEKMSNSLRGRKLSDEHKKKVSASLIGNKRACKENV